MKVCIDCGNTFTNENAKFCPYCGSLLEDIDDDELEINEKELSKINYCRNCGSPVKDQTNKYCKSCGAKLREHETQNDAFISKLKEYINGNSDYAEDVYLETFNISYQVAYKYVKNGNDAQDLAQETAIKLFNKLDTLKDPQKYYGFVKKIAKNKALDFLDNKFHIHENASIDMMITDKDNKEMEIQIEDNHTNYRPDTLMDEQFKNELIHSIIDELDEDKKPIVIMYYFDQESVEQIAKRLGIKESTVRGRIRLAQNEIKNSVEQIQNRDNIKLYNVSGIPALTFFMYLLGTYKDTKFRKLIMPETVASKAKINFKHLLENGQIKIIEKTVPPINSNEIIDSVTKNNASAQASEIITTSAAMSSIATAAAVKTGSSIATKIIVGGAIATSVVGGGYVINKKILPHTVSMNGITVTVPGGWNYQKTSAYGPFTDMVNLLFGSNLDVPALYLYDGEVDTNNPYVIITSVESSIELNNEFDGIYIEPFTVNGSMYEGGYGDDPYYTALDLYFINEDYYCFDMIYSEEGNWYNNQYADLKGLKDFNHGIYFQVYYVTHGKNDMNDSDFQEILGSISLDTIGTFKCDGDVVAKTESSTESFDGLKCLNNGTYSVFETKENNGEKWYRIGLYSWVSNDDGIFQE